MPASAALPSPLLAIIRASTSSLLGLRECPPLMLDISSFWRSLAVFIEAKIVLVFSADALRLPEPMLARDWDEALVVSKCPVTFPQWYSDFFLCTATVSLFSH